MQKHCQVFQIITIVIIFNQAFAHSGYNLIAKDIAVSNYQVSIYEDTHLLENQPQLSLFIKVSQANKAPNEPTLLTLNLDQNQQLILQEDLRNVGVATDNGIVLYQAYILETPIPETGLFDAVLTLETTDAFHQYPFMLNAEIQADIRLIEFIPSLLFILIPLIGLAAIFLNPYFSRKEMIHAKQTRFNHS